MGIEERVEATVKNVEGKVQEAAGKVTGDPKDKLEGQSKQVKAETEHAKEDIKDNLKQQID